MNDRGFLAVSTLAAGLLVAACTSTPQAAAQPPVVAADALIVDGALPRTGAISREELAALGTVEGHWTHHDKDHVFHGVPLDVVLVHMGFERGEMGPSVSKSEKAAGWKKAVLATAADGFQAAFSCAELMPSMGPTRAFVVWEMDGAPLPPDQGPLRLLVTTDKEGSRSPYALRRVEIVDLARAAGR